MATNPIPAGSVNFSLNLSREERLAYGKFAYSRGQALAELVRESLAEKAMRECPSTAERLRGLRESRRQLSLGLRIGLVVLSLIALALTLRGNPDSQARGPVFVGEVDVYGFQR